MSDQSIELTRAANLWDPLPRKFPPLAKAAYFEARPDRDLDQIGGLAEAKEEILTYACAVTHPEVYRRWGTVPPAALLLVGPPESGKTLLAGALALRTEMPFLAVSIPRLVLQLMHALPLVGPLLEGWVTMLAEMPRLTVLFREVDFSHVESMVSKRHQIPLEPFMDFVLEFIDRTIATESTQVVGSTSHPDALSPVFTEPGRFERIVAVEPSMPGDVAAALRIHAAEAEGRAGRPLFESVDWDKVAQARANGTIGSWLRLLHATLRRKARCEAASEHPGQVTTGDLIAEANRHKKSIAGMRAATGSYL